MLYDFLWFCYRVLKKIRCKILPFRDKFLPSFLSCKELNNNAEIGFLETELSEEMWQKFSIPQQVLEYYLEHRFNLLGSGWVKVKYGMKCIGFMDIAFPPIEAPPIDANGNWLKGRLNSANASVAKEVWQLIYKESNEGYTYSPIDWQLDFKSGYRWSEKTWYYHIKYGDIYGADVKVPWELSRMQHLPLLACAFGKYKASNPDFAKMCFLEFRNQILDFIATNPPRWGVNWSCTMDVAIRVANWVMAYELFRISGADLDIAFNDVFRRSVYEHSFHIIKNLEWHPRYRNNHYLANICGLIYALAWLPVTKQTQKWFSFAVREFFREIEHQFLEDGASFENSTSYHRLSTEMVLWCVALLMHMLDGKLASCANDKGFNSFLKEKLNEMAAKLEKVVDFTASIIKPDGHIPQIGDNDSGRFFAFDVPYMAEPIASAREKYLNLSKFNELSDEKMHYEQDFLNHKELLVIGSTILNKDLVELNALNNSFTYQLVSVFTYGKKLKAGEKSLIHRPQKLNYEVERSRILKSANHKIYEIS